MNMEPTETEFKKLFGELKAQDLRRLPSFGAVLTAAHADARTGGQHSRLRLAFGMATALVIVILTTLAVLNFQSRSREAEFQQWTTLSEWNAPTDALLGISNPRQPDNNTLPTDFF